MKRGVGEQVGHTTIVVVLFFASILTIYPFWHVLMYSLSDSAKAMEGGIFLWPKGFGLGQYKILLGARNAFVSLRNSLLRVCIGVPFNLIMTSSLAYALSRRDLVGRNAMNTMIFLTMLFSGGLIPSFLLMRTLGLYDNPLIYILPGAISAYNMFVMKTYFLSLPEDLEASALIEGAGPLRILLHIVLPVSIPVIAAIGMFSGVSHWNSWFDGMIYVNNQEYMLFQVFLRSMMLDSSYQALAGSGGLLDVGALTEESVKMAAITLSLVPVVIAYPFVHKYYIKGLMIGSIKG